MTDEELIDYLGLTGEPRAQQIVDHLRPGARAAYDRAFEFEFELQTGLLPNCVVLRFERWKRRR